MQVTKINLSELVRENNNSYLFLIRHIRSKTTGSFNVSLYDELGNKITYANGYGYNKIAACVTELHKQYDTTGLHCRLLVNKEGVAFGMLFTPEQK